jgi:phosphatidyl-myo-inositol dimannoside synthase
VSHVLVTNDFPPKTGGIQNYLYELWRRLPPGDVTVLTTRFAGSIGFDREQAFRVVRSARSVLLPSRSLIRQIRDVAGEVGAGLVVLDPALPLGLLGPRLGLSYAVVLHGAEITVPGRLPIARTALASVLSPARLLIAAGGYPAAEARRVAGRRMPLVEVIPPGVDVHRFRPLAPEARRLARLHLGLPPDGRLVVSVSRLVPRKGQDVLIEAVGLLEASMGDLCLAIGGQGRDRRRLEGLVSRAGLRGTVRLLGRVSDEDLPLLDGAADVWAMPCRDRWLGLEQEGFGIVFLEAAAAGVPQVAGRSGGAHEAVVNCETGLVVDDPADPRAVAAALRTLLEDASMRHRLGEAARKRAKEEYDYDLLAARLRAALERAGA